MVHGSKLFITKEYCNLSRPFFDLDEPTQETSLKVYSYCGIHGEYPVSLKAHGCPDCLAEDIDEQKKEEVVNKRLRKQKYR